MGDRNTQCGQCHGMTLIQYIKQMGDDSLLEEHVVDCYMPDTTISTTMSDSGEVGYVLSAA